MKTKHTAGEWRYDSKHAAICEGEAYSHFCNTLIANINPNLGNESQANAALIAAAPSLMQMVFDLMKCVNRLTEDGLTQEQRDKEAQWIGEAHELLHSINPDYSK